MKIDAFLVLTTHSGPLDGESVDAAYRKSIEILNFKTGGGTGTDNSMMPGKEDKRGKNYSPFAFEIDKNLDAASPHLFRAYCTTFSRRYVPEQNIYKKAEISFRKAGGPSAASPGTVYLTMVFTQVLLFSYSLSQSGVGMKETVKFAFQTCQLQYQEQTPAGGTQPPKEMKGWDFLKNKPN